MNFIKRSLHHGSSPSTTTTTTPSPPPPSTSSSSARNSHDASSSPLFPPAKTSSLLNSAVRFNDLISAQPKFNEREKYLTAYVSLLFLTHPHPHPRLMNSKYPQQQMQLIRKRLNVEFWLDDQLRFLYDLQVRGDVHSRNLPADFFSQDECSPDDHDHCPGDLIDSLLDIDDESERRTFLLVRISRSTDR